MVANGSMGRGTTSGGNENSRSRKTFPYTLLFTNELAWCALFPGVDFPPAAAGAGLAFPFAPTPFDAAPAFAPALAAPVVVFPPAAGVDRPLAGGAVAVAAEADADASMPLSAGSDSILSSFASRSNTAAARHPSPGVCVPARSVRRAGVRVGRSAARAAVAEGWD